jgi:hypothetical protein
MKNGIEQLFEELATKWMQETCFLSSPSRIIAHPACIAIAALGPDILPLILRKIEDDVSIGWLVLMTEITGENPVPKEDAGIVLRIRDHWLNWARKHNIEWRE